MRGFISALLLLMAAVVTCAGLEPISSAELCGKCHRAIHEAWKKSAHANAMESRLFQDALETVEKGFGSDTRKVCLGCHSPLALQTGDLKLHQKTSWEGVTCDYCHSLRGVSMAGGNPRPTLKFSSEKTGPLKGTGSPAHGTVFSEVHTSSLVCVSCHEYRNPQGVKVLTTYSEWKESRYYREQIQCQSCHMGRVAGNVVEPRIESSTDAKVNLHEMPGSHSLEQLNSAVRAQLTTFREENRLNVSVELSNAGAGHHVPTGSPMRELILEVNVDAYQGKNFREKRSYRRVVVDDNGSPIAQEHLAFFAAAKIQSDNRLAADEKRTESFSFEIPKGVPAQVTAKLVYSYSPLASAESHERVTFRSISRFVK